MVSAVYCNRGDEKVHLTRQISDAMSAIRQTSAWRPTNDLSECSYGIRH